MVGRELQKIRPYGEDHRGLVWGRKIGEVAGIWTGRMIDVLKK